MLVERAREAASVRIAAGSSDAVTPDAERLSRAAVARRTRPRIRPRFASVLAAARTHPARRMRVA